MKQTELVIGDLVLEPEDIDMLERLAEANGRSGQIYIQDDRISKLLIDLGWATTLKDSWLAGTDKLRDAFPKVRDTLLKIARQKLGEEQK